MARRKKIDQVMQDIISDGMTADEVSAILEIISPEYRNESRKALRQNYYLDKHRKDSIDSGDNSCDCERCDKVREDWEGIEEEYTQAFLLLSRLDSVSKKLNRMK